jgi:hypothetical protein
MGMIVALLASSRAATWDNCPDVAETIPWRLVPLDNSGLPTHSQRSLPDSATGTCELCNRRPRHSLSTVLVVDGPDGLPVPFLICADCRRALDELHTLLESAAANSLQT